ncbi:flagellar hook-basal body complex protein [Undibacter mobilis]|uniref:Flagellar hook protein FlgE n=1 Tax=Undibacter mobilis TaxID=2292256 RepID=A0A371BC46_9BRAD|nr:flagellar hook-basal body complex protein [Undibacter mobilis]RDV05179.1 flagellar hook-basal body complex protein [Undibacter mobilis]
MGIFGALTTAVTGMQAQAYALQNISGNIANSQTTAFKRTDTSFTDLLQDNIPSKQIAGNTAAQSRQTNTVQGDVQNASVPTFMAINGGGFFVVAKPDSFADGRPNFSGVDLYTRRGDFTLDQNGYLVNGAGYYLMGIPVDATTGNLAGSVPQMLQFQNGFLPATPTSEINYRANLPSYPKTVNADKSVPGSELLNPANYSANPVNGAPTVAKLTGYGATILPDAAAALTGSADLSALSSAGGTIEINGTPIAIAAADNAAAIVTKINAATGTTNVGATLVGNKLVLTGTNASTNITIGGGSTLSLLTEIGMSVGTTNATNLLTQGIAAAGQTLTFKVGANPTLTVTFGAGNVVTLADLNVQLATLVGGTASADPANGNITVSAASNTDTITVGGTATPRNFGIRTMSALPSNSTVVGQDQSTFLNESIAGGAVTAYDVAGSAVNVQVRWAKVDSSALGAGHTDKWNMFYQTNSKATGTAAAWQNTGVDYVFSANGTLTPSINAITLSNVTIDGVSLGTLRVVHATGGVTQYSDANGSVKVNQMEQNGFGAGELKTIAVSDKGRVTGTYSNGRTIDLAEVTLANFSGANGLKKLDGGAFAATAESGTPTYGAAGKIVGSSLEGSNTDIADEFTKLIVTQQAYSANTKVITTTNTMVQDLLNVIR